jgi:NOL1/NOP2/fmu family ribosome biogenesis protein
MVEADKGWNLIRHCGLNLGWAKVLPNRLNNYYPGEWRILKD